jgi:uncharacterized membrane protein
MLEWLQQADDIWQYLGLFILAILPWIDIFVVVPLGILWGLSPVVVSIVGFAGNFLMIVLLALFFRQLAAWRRRRRERKGITAPTKRETRARQIWERYGIPGLSIVAPILLGTDLAALLALSFGSSRMRVVVWMGVSLVIWTVILAVGSVYGFGYMKWI